LGRLSGAGSRKLDLPKRGERFPRPIETLDHIGLYCPEPVFRTKEIISEVPIGEILEVLADDPASESDISSSAKHAGHGHH